MPSSSGQWGWSWSCWSPMLWILSQWVRACPALPCTVHYWQASLCMRSLSLASIKLAMRGMADGYCGPVFAPCQAAFLLTRCKCGASVLHSLKGLACKPQLLIKLAHVSWQTSKFCTTKSPVMMQDLRSAMTHDSSIAL